MRTTQTIAECFRDLDFHDNTFVGMSILPAQGHSDIAGSVIEIRLSSGQSRVIQVLQFIGCANLRVALDFDVLAGNLPRNTSNVDARVDLNLIREFIQSQEPDWDVSYDKMRSPLAVKLEVIDTLVCFRVQFLGGVVEIIAKEFLIKDGGV